MKIVLVAVISKDGFITRGNNLNPSSWASDEDQKHYIKTKQQYKLHIMGSNTYKPSVYYSNNDYLTLVLTSKPEKYIKHQIPGKLEFINSSPEGLVYEYGSVFKSCLVLGGSRVYTDFLEAGLIDNALITIEPFLNKNGTKFINTKKKIEAYNLTKTESRQINSSGTVIIKYEKARITN